LLSAQVVFVLKSAQAVCIVVVCSFAIMLLKTKPKAKADAHCPSSGPQPKQMPSERQKGPKEMTLKGSALVTKLLREHEPRMVPPPPLPLPPPPPLSELGPHPPLCPPSNPWPAKARAAYKPLEAAKHKAKDKAEDKAEAAAAAAKDTAKAKSKPKRPWVEASSDEESSQKEKPKPKPKRPWVEASSDEESSQKEEPQKPMRLMSAIKFCREMHSCFGVFIAAFDEEAKKDEEEHENQKNMKNHQKKQKRYSSSSSASAARVD
jgi:hypothetical protein